MSDAKKGRIMPLSERPKHGRKGNKHSNWKGGRRISGHGYVLIYQSSPGKYKYEHRLVMEKHIGRPLKPTEIIHHINKNTTDNKIENLKIMTTAKHNVIHGFKKQIDYFNCDYCGKRHWKWKSKQNSKQHFCSRKCMGLAKRYKIKLRCPTCNKVFYKTKSQHKDTKRHFCSQKCWYDRNTFGKRH